MDIYSFQFTGEMLAVVVGALVAGSAGTLTTLIALDVIRERHNLQRRRQRRQPLLQPGSVQAV